jgi:hypothetical protein
VREEREKERIDRWIEERKEIRNSEEMKVKNE